LLPAGIAPPDNVTFVTASRDVARNQSSRHFSSCWQGRC